MPDANERSHRIGNQLTRLEAPNIVYLKLKGSVTVEEAQQINEARLEFAGALDSMFYLINLEELDDLLLRPAGKLQRRSSAFPFGVR
jgi:hypothetical protein